MRIVWSLPVAGEGLEGTRGDLVRARRLVEALRADGHQVTVVEIAAGRRSAAVVSTYRDLVRRALPRRLALLLRDLGRVAHARVHGRRVAAVARAERADLIVETQVHFAGSGALAARLSGLPLLLDDCSPLSEAVALGAGLPGLAARVFRRQVECAKWITVSSQALRARLASDGVCLDKLHVVPNGVDLAAHDHTDREAVRRRLGLVGRRVIGFVGSFQPWHRVELLLEAVAPLAERHAVHLLLIGDGSGRARAMDAARALGLGPHVTDVGAVHPGDVPALLAACDVGALPASNDYGHPMKLVEYAAAGLPAVAPDLPPIREVVREGVTGLLFLPGSAPALSEALARLVSDDLLRHRLGARARAEVAQSASWRERARLLLGSSAPQGTQGTGVGGRA
ncbi:MAG TPA: glycosyltransferase family 4 protein [Vicinamibacteria bacterium]|nr:glycosyltransferase family 4 protein [Vicinamibacteria bacterium]